MAIHILGGPSASQKVFHYVSMITKRRTTFMAETGMITMMYEDADGREAFLRLSRNTFVERMKAEGQVFKKVKGRYSDERHNHLNLLDVMIAVTDAAHEQGDPLSPAAIAQMLKCRLPCRVSFAGNSQSRAQSQASVLPATACNGTSDHRLISVIIGDRR